MLDIEGSSESAPQSANTTSCSPANAGDAGTSCWGTGSIELALIENVAREDLGVIEEARTIAALLNELDGTATSLARRLGRSRSDLAHTVRLLDLPDEAIELIDDGTLSKGHGKVHADRARPLPPP